MKCIYWIFALLLICVGNLNAEDIKGKLSTLEGIPIIGANIVWQNTNIGTISDKEGFFSISDEGIEDRTLVISYIGFSTEILAVGTIKFWDIQLLEDYTLTQVEVSSQSKATRFEDAPAKIEVIGAREIERAACCSLAGCFSTNASVNSATTNVVTNAKELQILGVSGVYNQLLFDGMPLIQGLSFAYGPGSYPGTMIENIYISKGTNSVLQGFESISGQINILPPSPETAPRLYLNAFVNSFGESQYNINHLYRKNSWSNFTALHLTLPATLIDRDGDNFRDIVKTQRLSLYNKWVYDNPDQPKFRTQVGFRVWDEIREGGTMAFSRKTDLGSNEVYGQTVDLTHFDIYSKMNFELKTNLSLTWLNSFFAQDQLSYFGVKEYKARQHNFTSSLYLNWFYGETDHNLKGGVSWRNNRLRESISFLTEYSYLDYAGSFVNDYDIPGLFAENTLSLKPFTIISGLRLDRIFEDSWKLTPRLLVRAELPKETDLRFSIGKGFRRVHPFSERINILASNRSLDLDYLGLEPEEAVNIGLNAIKKVFLENVNLTFSADAYYILFQNQVFPDFESFELTTYLDNFKGKSVSKSFQFENKIELYERFDLKWAYNYLHVYRRNEDLQFDLPFVPKHKFLANASYASKSDQWQFDVTYHWYGARNLPSTDSYPTRYQIDPVSQTYGRLDFQLTRRWAQFEIYTGVENIFDFRQEFPILAYDDPFGPYFDPTFNWGPTKGREIYLGLRYRVAQ